MFVRPISIFDEPVLLDDPFKLILEFPRDWTDDKDIRNLNQSVKQNSDRFEVKLNLRQFKPTIVSAKLVQDKILEIEGKHEDKPDKKEFSRQFARKILIPEGYDVNKLEVKLRSDDVLVIVAPNLVKQEPLTYKNIPVIPAFTLNNDKEGKVQSKL